MSSSVGIVVVGEEEQEANTVTPVISNPKCHTPSRPLGSARRCRSDFHVPLLLRYHAEGDKADWNSVTPLGRLVKIVNVPRIIIMSSKNSTIIDNKHCTETTYVPWSSFGHSIRLRHRPC